MDDCDRYLALKCATFIDAPWSELVITLGAYVLTIGYIQAFIVFYYSKAAQGLKRLLAGLGTVCLYQTIWRNRLFVQQFSILMDLVYLDNWDQCLGCCLLSDCTQHSCSSAISI
nr:hypothetical protein P5627_02130 [Bacillus safensis]